MRQWVWPGGFVVLLLVAAAVGCQRPTTVTLQAAPPGRLAPPGAPANLALDQTTYRITGPYSHANLAVYLLHADRQDNRDFMTLEEGLKSKQVRITEKAEGDVGELLLTNLSSRPLFLQEGDRLQGGKQDRTIYASLVVPPGTKKMPLPAFCIEPTRWAAGDSGVAFHYADGASLAPKAVRMAAKYEKDQSRVWDEVGKAKRRARESGLVAGSSATSSLNEEQDSPEVRKLADTTVKALGGALDGQADAVGVAVAVNGRVEEVDLYPGRPLLAKLYPRLLQSYALQTAAPGKPPKPPTTEEVARFLREGRAKERRQEAMPGGAGMDMQDYDDKVAATTRFGGAVVHRQLMRKEPAGQAGD
jgi:hypothetical protein